MQRLLRAPRPTLRRLALIAALAAICATGAGPLTHPSVAQASTASTMQVELLGWINNARVSRGLVPLKVWGPLASLAADRAATMASTGVLSHPSCLACVYTSRGIQWYSLAEDISETSYPWGDQAALSIFNGWKNSSGHWAILMSSTLNYIGIGVAYRSSNHTTFAAADLSESLDRTKPWAKMRSSGRSGSTVSWSWTGADTRLQTHTAGLKNFDVEYRVDGGTWTVIRSGTTATSLSIGSRAGGHYYGLRVRSRDYRGYVSSYTAELRIWVP
jgi:uncharacterized protein YkwD